MGKLRQGRGDRRPVPPGSASGRVEGGAAPHPGLGRGEPRPSPEGTRIRFVLLLWRSSSSGPSRPGVAREEGWGFNRTRFRARSFGGYSAPPAWCQRRLKELGYHLYPASPGKLKGVDAKSVMTCNLAEWGLFPR